MSESLVVIPARGGSKGVPGKNLKLLAGKPLIYWSIKSALDAKCIGSVSDDSNHVYHTAFIRGTSRSVKYVLPLPGRPMTSIFISILLFNYLVMVAMISSFKKSNIYV